MFLLSLISAALAGSTAGMGLSPIGGSLGGLNEPGALGLGATPTAARPEQAELGLDMGLNQWTVEAQLDGETPIEASGMVPMPYLAAAVPVGDFGIGLVGSIPFGGGGDFPKQGAQRFHLQEGKVFLMEAALALAYQPVQAVRVGVAARLARGTMKKRYAVDSAGLLNSRLGSDTSVPEGEALLEGYQELDIAGLGMGYALGISTTLPADIEVHLSYRSPMAVDLTGPAKVVPSNDIDLALTGTAHATMIYPREVAVGVVVPVGGIRIMADGGWTDWRKMERVDGTLEDVSVDSDDAALAALVAATGINETSLTEDQDIYNDLGNHDVFYGGAAVDVPLHERWTFRTGAWWAPTTIPEKNFHLGIVDFDAWDLRAAVAWTPVDALTLGLSADVFFIPDRSIDNSSLSLTNPPASGRVLPSANGEYAMRAARAGLTVLYRI